MLRGAEPNDALQCVDSLVEVAAGMERSLRPRTGQAN